MYVHLKIASHSSSLIRNMLTGMTLRIRQAGAISLIAFAGLGFVTSSLAAPIAVPNGDFSNAANNGHIGGGLLGGSASDVVIGTGPWLGSYNGFFNLLAPPTLTITTGSATISGLIGVNVRGILDNGGYFSQSLTNAYVAEHHYVLAADVDVGTTLTLGILSSGNAGIALVNASTTLASTATAPSGSITITLVSGTKYHLVLTYDTGASVSGNVGIVLFGLPQQLVAPNLLTSVTFGNVTLSASELNPTPASIATSGGTPQSATVGTAFAMPFSVTVLDAEGDPVAGATVTFTPPASGPSVTLSSTTAITDASGIAQVTGTANGIAGGPYDVSASASGVATDAVFVLTNTATSVVGTPSGGGQTATVNGSFDCSLKLTVTDDDSNPLALVDIEFVAPTSGASATLFNGLVSGTTVDVLTDVNGVASVTATANAIAGSYVVSAGVFGSGVTIATYPMTNLAAGDRIFADGFEGTPPPCN